MKDHKPLSNVAFYIPKVPDIPTTTQFNHARAIGETAERAILITEQQPPKKIRTLYDQHYLSTEESWSVLARIRQAVRVINQELVQGEGSGRVITTFHYVPAIVGFLTDLPWMVDIYDRPNQYVANNPKSMHQITLPVLEFILNRADFGYHTLHPDVPRTYGSAIEFGMNGAPYTNVTPIEKPSRPPLKCVCVGKTKLDQGMETAIRAIAQTSEPVHLEVYGEPFKEAKNLARTLDLGNKIEFHGAVPHYQISADLPKFHVGLCLLPPRVDWRYSYPLKIGEYLAAGVNPIATDFPGIQKMLNGVGTLVNYRPEDIAQELDRIVWEESSEYEQVCREARNRASEISLRAERERFAEEALTF